MTHHIHNMVAKVVPTRPSAADITDEPVPDDAPTRYLYTVCEGAVDEADPYQHGCGLDSRIRKGAQVRVVNWAGPCLNGYRVVSVGKSRYKLDRGYGTRGLQTHDFKHFIEVHIDPCTRCTDHPQSSYPNGYTN